MVKGRQCACTSTHRICRQHARVRARMHQSCAAQQHAGCAVRVRAVGPLQLAALHASGAATPCNQCCPRQAWQQCCMRAQDSAVLHESAEASRAQRAQRSCGAADRRPLCTGLRDGIGLACPRGSPTRACCLPAPCLRLSGPAPAPPSSRAHAHTYMHTHTHTHACARSAAWTASAQRARAPHASTCTTAPESGCALLLYLLPSALHPHAPAPLHWNGPSAGAWSAQSLTGPTTTTSATGKAG